MMRNWAETVAGSVRSCPKAWRTHSATTYGSIEPGVCQKNASATCVEVCCRAVGCSPHASLRIVAESGYLPPTPKPMRKRHAMRME